MDLLRAHQVVAELVVAHDLRVQHLDYHPAIHAQGRAVQLTTITVAVPSEPAELVRWCAALGINETAVRVRVGQHDLTAAAVRHELRWRITTTLRGPDRDRLHPHVRWDRDERTGRRRDTGIAHVIDVVAALGWLASTTSTPAPAPAGV